MAGNVGLGEKTKSGDSARPWELMPIGRAHGMQGEGFGQLSKKSA